MDTLSGSEESGVISLEGMQLSCGKNKSERVCNSVCVCVCVPEGECVAPRLMLRSARDTHTHMGSCTHTRTLALNGWQLSLTYSSDTIRFRFLLNWYLHTLTPLLTNTHTHSLTHTHT